MRNHHFSLPLTLTALAAALVLSGCSSMPSLPSLGGSAELPPEPAVVGGPVLPSRYRPEEIVGRWGYTSYQREADRARTVAAAGRLCRQPYVIARGPTGGVMMNLADQRQTTELRLKGGPGERNFIGPDGEPGGSPQDREILSFDGRVLVTRFVDPDAANRYGNMVYVRCGARA
jgi:hypothetical protein